MKPLVRALIDWPQHVAQSLYWLAPLFTRITVGWVFLWSGWGKLTNLPRVIENFGNWGLPAPDVLAPLTAGIEFFGGIFLLIGFITRIAAGALGVVMIVATLAVQWEQVDSYLTLAGLEETLFLALFLWLAIDGPGRLSVDRLLQERWP